MFNGNIAAMAVNLPSMGGVKVYGYHYDQLNRLVAMDAYDGLSPVAGTFTPIQLSDYRERITYDPNGNILTYQRNGDAARHDMDSLTYFYTGGTNRLTDVYSGKDSVMLLLFPEREAHYSYYKHGSLARIELGQLKVQGLDYVYTLQGWLKGINLVRGGTLANGANTVEMYPTARWARSSLGKLLN